MILGTGVSRWTAPITRRVNMAMMRGCAVVKNDGWRVLNLNIDREGGKMKSQLTLLGLGKNGAVKRVQGGLFRCKTQIIQAQNHFAHNK